MHTSGVAIFVPFTTQGLFQLDGTYYGLNTVSGNMIMANRSNLKNPNGLILGTPGSGNRDEIINHTVMLGVERAEFEKYQALQPEKDSIDEDTQLFADSSVYEKMEKAEKADTPLFEPTYGEQMPLFGFEDG